IKQLINTSSVIKRLISLLSTVARKMADSAAARKQAEGAHRHLQEAMQNDSNKPNQQEKSTSSGQGSNSIDRKEYDAEIEKYQNDAIQAREAIEVLREKYDTSVQEYDRLCKEHQKLQNKLDVLSKNESTKDK
ncbi:unnamed protein product, partial [Rotaria magnacalcarata]